MKHKAIVAGLSAAVGVATAVTALVVGTSTGYAANTTSSAYGGSATGAAPFGPTPTVESTDGSTQTTSAASLPANDYIAADTVKLTAGNDTASSSVGSVHIGSGLLPTEFTGTLKSILDPIQEQCALPTLPVLSTITGHLPGAITGALPSGLDPADLCNAIGEGAPDLLGLNGLEASCDGDTGTVSLGSMTLLGQSFDLPALDKTTAIIPDNDLITVTANKQVANDDGSFSVTGLSIDVAGQETINLVGVTCGKPQAQVAGTSTTAADRDCAASGGDVGPDTPLTDIYDNPQDVESDPFDLDRDNDGTACDGGEEVADAPAPSPVTTDLPVTG